MNQQLLNYVIATLNDEHGISETAMDRLVEIVEGTSPSDEYDSSAAAVIYNRLVSVLRTVKSANGRYYLPPYSAVLDYVE